MIPNFHKVNDELYRGGAPTVHDVIHLKDKYDINKIVSLDEFSGKRIDKVCKLLHIKHIMMPIDIAKRSSLLKFLSHDIVDMVSDGPTYIHCQHGKDRTGLAMALYRCEHDGWSCKRAIKEAKSFGFGIGVDPMIVALYERIIKKSCGCADTNDVNSAYDIVSNEQSNPSNNLGYTLDALEQINWSPYSDYRVREFPFSTIDSEWPEQYNNRQDRGLSDALYVDTGEIPQVGTYDQNTNGINGSGPSLVGTGIL